jgi:hypothetical protein
MRRVASVAFVRRQPCLSPSRPSRLPSPSVLQRFAETVSLTATVWIAYGSRRNATQAVQAARLPSDPQVPKGSPDPSAWGRWCSSPVGRSSRSVSIGVAPSRPSGSQNGSRRERRQIISLVEFVRAAPVAERDNLVWWWHLVTGVAHLLLRR